MTTKRKKLQSWIDLFLEQSGLVIAWLLTARLRLALNASMAHQFTPEQLYRAAPPLWVLLPVWLLAAWWLRQRTRSQDPVPRLLEVIALADMTAIATTFFLREVGAPLSRSFVLLFIPISFLTLFAMYFASTGLKRLLVNRWPVAERVAIVGRTRDAVRLLDCLTGSTPEGLQIAGVILPDGSSSRGLQNLLPVLGSTDQLAEVINRERLDRLVFAENSLPAPAMDECTRISKQMGLTATRAIGAVVREDVHLDFATVSGLELLEMRPKLFTRRVEKAKRAIDIVLTSAVLIVLSPLLLVIAALIKLSSPGPVLYTSPRVGRGGRYFIFLKFRSMYCGREDRDGLKAHNEKGGHIFKMKDDPRVTPVGRILRKYSLDELPQLFNVLRGDMSLVGPRPLPAQDLNPDGQSREFGAWSQQRCRVLPGITGLWQISGRSELPFEKMVELDTAYIREWSLRLDIKILLKTPLVVLRGAGAY